MANLLKKYIRELPFFEALKNLKIWMDGRGPFPANQNNYLRLEDKWVQFLILSSNYPLIPTSLFNKETVACLRESLLHGNQGFILKRRFGRGGRGQLHIMDSEDLTM